MKNLIKIFTLKFAALLLIGCAQPPLIDFNKILNSSIGMPLAETSYGRVGSKRLISETSDSATYLYRMYDGCSWEVDISKATTIVLRWKYSSPESEKFCNNLVGQSI